MDHHQKKKVSHYYFQESSGVISSDPYTFVKSPIKPSEIIVREEEDQPIDKPYK